MGRKSSLETAKKSKKAAKINTRMNWKDDNSAALVIVSFYVSEYTKYMSNKAKTTRRWADILQKDKRFKNTGITDRHIKNFVAKQESDFRRALEKRNSTGFGDLDKVTATEQLTAICKYWYVFIITFIALIILMHC